MRGVSKQLEARAYSSFTFQLFQTGSSSHTHPHTFTWPSVYRSTVQTPARGRWGIRLHHDFSVSCVIPGKCKAMVSYILT